MNYPRRDSMTNIVPYSCHRITCFTHASWQLCGWWTISTLGPCNVGPQRTTTSYPPEQRDAMSTWSTESLLATEIRIISSSYSLTLPKHIGTSHSCGPSQGLPLRSMLGRVSFDFTWSFIDPPIGCNLLMNVPLESPYFGAVNLSACKFTWTMKTVQVLPPKGNSCTN